MKDIKERIAVVEQVAANAHKRIDSNDIENKRLRDKGHDHANVIQKHEGILESHGEIFAEIKLALKDLVTATSANTGAIASFRIMAITSIWMGGAFISFVMFVGSKLMGWW